MAANAAAPPPQRCPVCDLVVPTYLDLAGRLRVERHHGLGPAEKVCSGSLMVPKGESDPLRQP